MKLVWGLLSCQWWWGVFCIIPIKMTFQCLNSRCGMSWWCWQLGRSAFNHQHCCALRHRQKCAKLSSGIWMTVYLQERQTVSGPATRNGWGLIYERRRRNQSAVSIWTTLKPRVPGWGHKCNVNCLERQPWMRSRTSEPHLKMNYDWTTLVVFCANHCRGRPWCACLHQ